MGRSAFAASSALTPSGRDHMAWSADPTMPTAKSLADQQCRDTEEAPGRAPGIAQDRAPGIIEEFDFAVAQLEEWIAEAYERLKPVTAPSFPPGDSFADPIASVSEGRALLNRIHGASASLAALLQQVEV